MISKPKMQLMKKAFLLISLPVFLFGCTKENSDSFFPYPLNPVADTAWAAQVPTNNPASELMQSLAIPPATINYNAPAVGEVPFPNLTQVMIPANSLFLPNGALYTGPVKVEVVQVRSKGDMIRTRRPSTNFGRLIQSEGSFLVRVTANGQELFVNPNSTFRLRYRVLSPHQNARVFYGVQNLQSPLPPGTNKEFTWISANDSSFARVFTQQDSTGVVRGYEVFAKKFGWLQIGNVLDTLNTTRIDALLPFQFTNVNTQVFAVFKNENIVVQLAPEFISRSFLAINIPTGKQVILVSLSKVNGSIYLGTSEITASAGMLPVAVQPTVVTKAELEQYLQSL